ncbi:hypothetical protein [Allopontixanthobacter sp.]|uniref:hypothetical protein n=1 Tax=Allopontixanthobacter sp. TaxID=2906452 RepID=UPI002ABCFF30|nr:hypothetical protein [Allopontixanthobacter sp.]MDZ4308510.1 hypothetical protein [Allopontixanthobacter sp.]
MNQSRRQSRRESLRLIAGAAAMPMLAAVFPRFASAAVRAFDPPASPMNLTRTVLRDLPGGTRITVRRSWEVRFSRVEDGFSLTGRQISVDVDVPPRLQALAQMEQSREETGLFPMILSPDGVITGGEENPDSTWFDRAVGKAAEQIEGARMPEAETERIMAALSALQSSATGPTGKVPRDLFRPQPLQWQVNRDVELPGGLSGTIAVLFDARMDAAGQLMAQSERRILSAVGGSSRTSSEIWALGRS